MIKKPLKPLWIQLPPRSTSTFLCRFKSLSFVLLTVFLLFACKKDALVEKAPEGENIESPRTNGRSTLPSFDLLSSRGEGTIAADLAEWFEAYVEQYYPNDVTYILGVLDPKWEVLDGANAGLYISQSPSGPIINIPVNHFMVGLPGISRLHFQQQGEEIEVSISSIIPEEEYLATASSPEQYINDFTGVLSFFHLHAGLKGNILYSNGIASQLYLPIEENLNDSNTDDRCPGCTWDNLFPNTELDGTGGSSSNGGNITNNNGNGCLLHGTVGNCPYHNHDNENGGFFTDLNGNGIPPWMSDHFNNGNVTGIGGFFGGGGSGGVIPNNNNNTNNGPPLNILDETLLYSFVHILVGLGYNWELAVTIATACYQASDFEGCVAEYSAPDPDPTPDGDEALANSVHTFLSTHGLDELMSKMEIISFQVAVKAEGCEPGSYACFAATLFGISEEEAQQLINYGLLGALFDLKTQLGLSTGEVQQLVVKVDDYLSNHTLEYEDSAKEAVLWYFNILADPDLEGFDAEFAAIPSFVWPFITEVGLELAKELFKRNFPGADLPNSLIDAVNALQQGDLLKLGGEIIDIVKIAAKNAGLPIKAINLVWDGVDLGLEASKAWKVFSRMEKLGNEIIEKFIGVVKNKAGGILGKLKWKRNVGAELYEAGDPIEFWGELVDLFPNKQPIDLSNAPSEYLEGFELIPNIEVRIKTGGGSTPGFSLEFKVGTSGQEFKVRFK